MPTANIIAEPLTETAAAAANTDQVRSFITPHAEVIRTTGAPASKLTIQSRAENDTDFHELKAGDKITRVVIMNDVQAGITESYYSNGPSAYAPISNPSGLRYRIEHWIDLALSIMCSPSDQTEQNGENYDDSFGNWSMLPAGFGLGDSAHQNRLGVLA